MATTSPGWYDDGHGALRWWDGTQWTEHVAAPDPEPAAEAATTLETPADAAPAPTLGSTPVPDPATELFATTQDGSNTASQYSGAFMAATEPRKSKLWILWVVLGVLLLGFVIAVAIIVPLVIFGMSSSSSTSSSVEASSADEQAAVEAVEMYDQAWATADCESYFTATTEAFRTNEGAVDCTEFNDLVTNFAATTSDYSVTITDIDVEGESISIETEESYLSAYDNEGNPADPAISVVDSYEYVLVEANGDWAIESILTR
jgi:hypothetical protein